MGKAFERYIGKTIIDLVLAGFPQATIISVEEYGFYASYAPDHFYAWRDQGIEWTWYGTDLGTVL